MAFQDMRSAPGVEEGWDVFGTQKQWMGVRHPVAPPQIEARLVRVSDTGLGVYRQAATDIAC